MKNKKIVKSNCDKAWLFNVKTDNDFLITGLACFVHSCPMEVQLNIGGKERTMIVPSRAMNSAVPLRMLNVRLSLLPLTNDEQIL